MKEVQTKVRNDQEKKYLTFKLAEEQYGLEIHKVIEIIGMQDITPVPRTPDYLRGVINLRGIIHPVIDLKQKFGMGMTRETELTCIIVVTVNRDNKQEQIGIIVDEVLEVEDINEQDIEQSTGFGQGINTQFILGMAKTKGGVKMILDLQKTLNTRELDIISNIKETKNDNV